MSGYVAALVCLCQRHGAPAAITYLDALVLDTLHSVVDAVLVHGLVFVDVGVQTGGAHEEEHKLMDSRLLRVRITGGSLVGVNPVLGKRLECDIRLEECIWLVS